MKKIYIISLVLFSYCTLTNAQSTPTIEDAIKANLPQIIPPSPQSQVFEKYINHKVTEYNGLPDISIPIGEISTKGITVPIILSYHASGIKYYQMDSDVGAGWSINVGGYRISRTINGKSDFDYKKYSDEEFTSLVNNKNEFKLDRYLGRIATYYNRNDMGSIMAGLIKSDDLDSEKDMFTFNTPTSNGHFILSGSNMAFDAMVLEKTNERITVGRERNTIVDENGNTYYFGSYAGKNYIEETYVEQAVERHNVGWPLVELETPNGESISFEYKSYTFQSNRNTSDFVNFEINDASRGYSISSDGGCLPILSNGNNDISSTKMSKSYSVYNVKSYYIHKISSPVADVIFNRKDNNAQEKNTPTLISSIEIRYKNSSIVKKIIFNYKKSPETIEEGTPWHYILSSVKITDSKEKQIDKQYQFEYYEPKKYMTADQWGYYVMSSSHIMKLHSEFGNDNYYITNNSTTGISRRDKVSSAIYRYTTNRANNPLPNYFSLKKIIHPTGGYTEYEYEGHTYESYEGGGLRIKNIKTKDSDDSVVLETTYQYSKGKPSFPVSRLNYSSAMVSFWYTDQYCSGTDMAPSELWFSTKKTYSMNPTGDIPLSDFKVSYPEVTISRYKTVPNSNAIFDGKTVFKHLIPERYKTESMISSSSSLYPLGKLHFPGTEDIIANSVVNVSEYALGYNPQLLEKTIYNADNKQVYKESYSYTETDVYKSKGLKVSKQVFFSTPNSKSVAHQTLEGAYPYRWLGVYNGGTFIGRENDRSAGTSYEATMKYHVYNYINSFFTYMPYYIKMGRLLPESKITATYDKNGLNPVVTTEKYEYDNKYRIKKISLSNSVNNNLVKEFQYPINSLLSSRNMINTVIETVTKNNGQEIGRIKNVYNDNSIFPEAIQTSATGQADLRTEVTFDKYDALGNIQQMTTLDGISTIYLWSYLGKYPVAEIKNATYDEVNNALGQVGLVSISNLSNLLSLDKAKLDQLRSILPASMISTYSYTHPFGICEATNPAGITTYYSYNDFGQLKQIRNNDKQLVSGYHQSLYLNPSEPKESENTEEPEKPIETKEIVFSKPKAQDRQTSVSINCSNKTKLRISCSFKKEGDHEEYANASFSFGITSVTKVLTESFQTITFDLELPVGESRFSIDFFGDYTHFSYQASATIRIISILEGEDTLPNPISFTGSYDGITNEIKYFMN